MYHEVNDSFLAALIFGTSLIDFSKIALEMFCYLTDIVDRHRTLIINSRWAVKEAKKQKTEHRCNGRTGIEQFCLITDSAWDEVWDKLF